MSKPFDLQSPETIAKEYGGNKQRIVQAMQLGVVDPTAGVLAGMFIDRMRSAQAQEMAPQSSVAQQVMAPPPPPGAPPAPAGLGATPEAAMLGAPSMGGMGAPPPGGMGAPPGAPPSAPPPGGPPPLGDMPPGAPPMGMADGGLAALPISESMFDEPMDGEYAGGGIVAFAQGDAVGYEQILRDNMAYYSDPQNYMRDVEARYQPKREYAERANQFNKDLLSEAGQKKRRGEDINSFLMQFGAKLASTPGSLLTAAGKAGTETLPALQEATKERRAEVRDALKQLAADENMTNAERRAFVIEGMKGRGEAGKIANDFAQRASSKELAQIQEAGADRRTKRTTDATRYAADQSREGYTGAEKLKTDRINIQVSTAVAKDIDAKLAGPAGQTKMPELGGRTYRQLLKTDPKAAATFRRGLISAGVNDYITGFGATEAVDLGSM